MTDLGNRQVGFLIAPGSRDRFDRAVIRESEGHGTPTYGYLATGSFVVLPGPMPLSGDRYQWLAAPTRAPEPSPLRVVALAVMLVAATGLLERVDRYGEEFPVSAAMVGATAKAEAVRHGDDAAPSRANRGTRHATRPPPSATSWSRPDWRRTSPTSRPR
ncbi:hypothetical protein ACH4E8_08585 [Streptomyces sp. NPDC017979]|uniref:hypothetical protein n=1 Tax=Streptomyces sp. NPDC017979 TaxID=3365024 RepID=UPI00378EE6DB